jgi:hypothetical protein
MPARLVTIPIRHDSEKARAHPAGAFASRLFREER